eukprot:TRINITY_DN992_c0_g3_i2.p1 TRINITY_DN992_c0_g3~~TRINITY_DN992_c0_g3_i2.p1  ORF type:complete len:132 (+),score=34.85 TRINITY_DN992_c0_g3_i2:45-398(+)
MRKLDKVLTVVVSLSALLNIGAGIAAFILYISSGKVAESFLGAYLAFFGLAQLFSQMKSEGKTSSKLIRNNFGFMTTWFGLGIFLLLYVLPPPSPVFITTSSQCWELGVVIQLGRCD